MSDTLVGLDEFLDVIDTGDAGLHLACCVEPKFYCGAPYHPESVAGEDDDEDDCCKPCVDRRYQLMCPPVRSTHQHCPFNPRRVCAK
jgi:hypothetical protein